jgi:hypothetical protein
MSVTALPAAAPLQLLHPLWCLEGSPQRDDAPHRGALTCWEAMDARFTLGLIRWDEPRYLDGQREVNADRGTADEPGEEHVELTMTSTGLVNPDGSPIQVDVDLEDVPSSVELRWRPDDHQATFTVSS